MNPRNILICTAALGLALGVWAIAGTRLDAQGINGSATILEPSPDSANVPQAQQRGPVRESPDPNDRPALAATEELSVPRAMQGSARSGNSNTAIAYFCNKSGVAKIWLAQSYWDIARNDWAVEGWWGLDNGSCLTFERAGSSVYYHAFGGQFKWWNAYNADTNFCAPPGRFKSVAGQSKCAPKEYAGFKKLLLNAAGVAQADFHR